MAGCRGLSDSEVALVLTHLGTPRDRCLFILGIRTGFRISELLSLTIKDVFQGGQIVDRVRVQKRNVKGKQKSREVALHPQAKEALLELVQTMAAVPAVAPLFLSGQGIYKALSRHGAHKALKLAYKAAGLTGSLATHSMRKSFSQRVYKALKHDLLATKEALGHSDIRNTVRYLETNQDQIDSAILAA